MTAPNVPKPYQKFREQYPVVWAAYDQLGESAHLAGPLDLKTRELVKLAFSIGGGHEGAVHSHTRKLLALGATPEEIRHVVVLALTTLGFPTTISAMTWVDDILEPETD